MKIKDLLKKHFEVVNLPSEYIIQSKNLQKLKQEILTCDEFSKVDNLYFMDRPSENDKEGNTITTKTILLGEDTQFIGDFYLYSIQITPEIFDAGSFMDPVKDGCSLTPVLYNPQTFLPIRKMIIGFELDKFDNSVEFLNIANDITPYKKYIHEMVDKIIDNHKEYTKKGKRAILLRGCFKTTPQKGEFIKQHYE